MTASALLSDLAARRVLLTVDAEGLSWRAPRGVLTSEDLQALQQHKEELLSLLASPGRGLAGEARGRLAGCQEAAPGLPALCLYRDAEGRPRESWLVALPSLVALNLKAMRPPVVATPVPGTPWGRADMPAGRLPDYLLERILRDCPEGLEPPSADLLEERDRLASEEPSASSTAACAPAPGRPLLFHRLQAGELAVLVPAPTPPQGLPEACPACRSIRPEWAPLSAAGRFLCRRCWSAAP